MYEQAMWCGPNDGGIKRGDRADTGDLEAEPTEGIGSEGSGTGTADPGIETYDEFGSPDEEPTSGANIDDLTVHAPEDGTLGLTNIGNKPPEDWAADTGPTHTGEEFERGSRRR